MSVFLSPAATNFQQLLIASDERILPPYHRYNKNDRTPASMHMQGFLWTSASFLGGGGSVNLRGNDVMQDGQYWEAPSNDDAGGQQVKKIVGHTLDSSGNPLGNCIVQGFVTATDVFVGQVTSDAAGYYELPTAFTANHYVTAYKAGSPDVAGTSVNTLTPV